jgi:Ca2+ transporting ATPase
MFKHIIGQALYQLIVLIFLVFYGEHLLTEAEDGFDHTPGFQRAYKYDAHGMARSGRMLKINGNDDYETVFIATGVYSRHITFVFNTFVMMQIFNFFNSRKIHNEVPIPFTQINIFSHIGGTKYFILIVAIIFAIQVILVTFGGVAFGVYPYYGLRPIHWLISVHLWRCRLLLGFWGGRWGCC